MNVKRISHFRPANIVSVFICAATLVGCAALPATTPEDLVSQRAKARWEALLAGDIDGAYTYLAPSYRAVRDLKQYRATISGAVQWKAVEVVGVSCKQEACTARVRIDFVFPAAPGVYKSHYDEQWVVEDGSWWFYQKP